MRQFGLIGKTLGHSFSKSYFEDYFKKNEVEAIFSNFELAEIEQITAVFDQTISGLSVTIPYKENIIPFLDEVTQDVTQIGAVNCVQFKDGKTIGHNTDVYGFQQSIKPFLTNQHERAIILGTGGASKAVKFVLEKIGLDCIFISRNPKGEKEFSYEEINSYMLNACKLIVNTTPVGTFPNVTEKIEFPYSFLTDKHLVVDLIYNPAETAFLKNAKERGSTTLNGETMLKQQAMKAWEIWNDF